MQMKDILNKLGIESINAGVCAGVDGWMAGQGEQLTSINPTTNEVIAAVSQASAAD